MPFMPVLRQAPIAAALGLAISATVATVPAAADQAFVSCQNAGVTVLDLATRTVTVQYDLSGKGPRGIGVTTDGKRLVVATRETGGVVILDAATGAMLGEIKVGKNPEFVRIRGERAFVSYEPSAEGGPPPKPGEAAAKSDDDGDEEPARIAILDLKKGKKIGDIVGGPETEGIEFSKDGKKLIVTNEADNTVTVHDIATRKLLKTVKTADYGNRPRGIKVSPDGKTYVATLEVGNKFMVMDDKFKVIKTVDTGKSPYGVAFDRKGERLYVAAGQDKKLEVFDAKTFDKLGEVTTGGRCWHFSFTPDDRQILLACGKSNEVVTIDTASLEVTHRLEGFDTPWGVVTYPKSMGSLDQP
jgi:YVTN family beta-propeller protein